MVADLVRCVSILSAEVSYTCSDHCRLGKKIAPLKGVYARVAWFCVCLRAYLLLVSLFFFKLWMLWPHDSKLVRIVNGPWIRSPEMQKTFMTKLFSYENGLPIQKESSMMRRAGIMDMEKVP